MLSTRLPSILFALVGLAALGGSMVGCAGRIGGIPPSALTARLPGPTAAPPPSASATEIPRSADGMFYVDAEVNGEPMHFLLDTGASVVVLTPDDAKRLGIDTSDRSFDGGLETAGGRAPTSWTTLASLDFAGHRVRNVRAAIVTGGIETSLLGQNALSELHSVTMRGDRLSLR